MLQSVREIQTRFLWPFAFKRLSVEAASRSLRAANFQGTDLWKCVAAPRSYRDEYLDHTTEFLFGGSANACEYFVLEPRLVERWFADCELDMGHAEWLLLRAVPGPGIELFLSPHGTGVLSLTLAPTTKALTAEVALDFNYRVAQQRRRATAVLRKRHPTHDPEALGRLSPQQRADLDPIPPVEAPLDQRLGARGASFELASLVEVLLAPIRGLAYRPVQREFCVYTVARLGQQQGVASQPPPDLSDLRTQPEIATFLSSLCQVEESGHAGSPPSEVTADHALLNRLHRTAVSALGAAHVVADQGGVPYDDQRLVTVRDKYFPAYLAALLQRVTLNTDIQSAGEVARMPQPHAAEALTELRRHIMDFAVRGNGVEVSTRNAVQRSYELARSGLRVEKSWSEVRSAIQDLDAYSTSQQLATNTLKAEKSLDAIKKVQRVVHFLEYVLVSVYFAHMFHMLEITHAKTCLAAHCAGLLGSALLGILLVWCVDKWFERHESAHGA